MFNFIISSFDILYFLNFKYYQNFFEIDFIDLLSKKYKNIKNNLTLYSWDKEGKKVNNKITNNKK